MTELLRAENLYCERDERVLFNHLDFSLQAGEILHVKGPNGAGKTTLLRRLVGLSWVVEGQLKWHDSLSEQGEKLDGHGFWYLAHRPAVTLQQTPLENLAFAVALHNQNLPSEAIWQALDTVGLRGYEDVPAGSLSAGQQRRVSLARLYLDMPSIKLWLLDEPFTALDVNAVRQLERRIEAFAESGGTVVMTSHHGLTHTAVRELLIGAPL
ncbi:cytochrome c biogenesis heme-transporting ATPase CcmA [Reinekea sp. G2M2-21]|uniref:cytochrome c biogenesis heme-transporting ATPase CcmA n=1 Tax=Reinekea sp. G2M2-21 TaxID=2788942 RepID=UPI0018AC0D33|nr:cytochrome c biogenesis heme-transporting ATPase CcmA [Reinekea sp. G2M2-21]